MGNSNVGEAVLPRRSWTTDAGAWLLLAANVIWIIVNTVNTVQLVWGDRQSLGDTDLTDGEVTGVLVVVLLVIFVPFHALMILVGRALLRRRGWTRWVTTVSLAPIVLWAAINAAGAGLGFWAWVTTAANLTILILIWHPRTGRDIWWAQKAHVRPDYVQQHSP